MDLLFDKICDFYNLGKIINVPKIVSGGITNKVYKIDTNKSSYIFKLLTTKDIQKYECSEAIAHIASTNNINVLYAIKCNDRYVNTIDGVNVSVYPFYDGKVLKSNELSLGHIKLLAESLGRLHSIKIDKKYNISKYKKNDYKSLYDKLNDDSCYKTFKENINKIIEINNKTYDSYNKLSNNYSYVHKDFNRKNVLWKKYDFKIIDWETSTIDNPIIDFFNSAWFLTNDVEEDKFNVFIEEYFKYNSFKDNLKNGVYAAIIEECNWLYFSLQRALSIITKDPYEIDLGKESINSSTNEIINYYNKIDLMIRLLTEKGLIK